MILFVLAAVAVAAWLPAASWLVLAILHYTLPAVTIEWTSADWVDVLAYRHAGWRVAVPLVGAAIVASLPLVLIAVAAIRRAWSRSLVPKLGKLDVTGPLEPTRGRSGNHGSVDWMPMDIAKKRLYPSPGGEPFLVIGEAYRVDKDTVASIPFNERDRATWGQGGTAPLLVDPCTSGPTHAFICAGSGGMKTTSLVTRLMCWTGSAIVLDPSNEIGLMCGRARADMGQEVVMLGLGKTGLNILSSINPRSPVGDRRLLSVVAAICGEEPERDKNAIFSDAGRRMVTAVLGHMLWDTDLPACDRTVAFFRELIAAPADIVKLMLGRIAVVSKSSVARLNASILLGLADDTFTSAYFNASQFCSWLFNDDIASMLSNGTLRASDVVHKPMTVFVHVPLDVLETTPAVARVVIDALVWAFIDADGDYHARTLLLVDEASKLGKMAGIGLVRDVGRKYGLTLCLSYLSDAEIEAVWGKGSVSRWKNTVSWFSYASIGDPEFAEQISRAFGEYGVLAASEGTTDGSSGKPMETNNRSKGSSINVHEQAKRLIFAHELMAARSDEQFVFRKGGAPIRCGLPAYFRRPEIAAMIEDNRFARKTVPQ